MSVLDEQGPEERAPVSSAPLAPESPISLIVDGVPLAVLMCTPYEIDELAVGHLLSRGLISSRDDLRSLSICPDMKSVKAATLTGCGASARPEGLIHSACGAAQVEQGFHTPVLTAAAPLADLGELSLMAREMFAAAELYRKTGGLHVAALGVSEQSGRPRYFVVREDVGRHNAVDKVLGRGLLDKADFSRSILLTSGRLAADMVQKAARAGIPLLVTRSIPTTEAYRIANDAGITLVGRIGSAKPIVYTRPDRISPFALPD